VRHSNVVTVYGADRDGDETGIWMEYIEGQTLARMVSSGGPLSAREVTGVGVDLCRALAALHGAGLLHRDIKAQNVMREVGGRIVLMDFSGAQTITRESGTTITSGTPLYMAPELLERGDAVRIRRPAAGVLLLPVVRTSPVEATRLRSERAHAEGHASASLSGPTCRADRSPSNAIVSDAAEIPDRASSTRARDRLAPPSPRGTADSWRSTREARRGLAGWRASPWRRIIAASREPGPCRAWFHIRSSPTSRSTPFTSGSWPGVSPDGRRRIRGHVAGRDRFWVGAGDVGGVCVAIPRSPDGEPVFLCGRQTETHLLTVGRPPSADAPEPRR
jgi:serine/threonine protein kinase